MGSVIGSTIGGPTLDPHSPQAAAIAHLFRSTLSICAVILLLVIGLVTACLVRFRARGKSEPVQVEGSRRLEIAWTVVPFLILVWLMTVTTRTMALSDPPADRAPDVTVSARQWWWEVRYASGAITANEIHIPVGKPLLFRLESPDVVHDFWVPQLGRKMDVIPGRPRNIWMQADEPGIYLGTCAEYCGAQHAWMRIRVIAEEPARFAAWERHELTLPPPPATAQSARGQHVFAERSCAACHAIQGISNVRTAPDLTHLAERATLGAGVLENSPLALARWLKDPQQIKPGSHMPNAELSDSDVSDLVAYFETLQ
jgi:cytochrome c oxidase subunit 2